MLLVSGKRYSVLAFEYIKLWYVIMSYVSIIVCKIGLTLAVCDGGSDGILLAPTSCLIGAMSVLVHEM